MRDRAGRGRSSDEGPLGDPRDRQDRADPRAGARASRGTASSSPSAAATPSAPSAFAAEFGAARHATLRGRHRATTTSTSCTSRRITPLHREWAVRGRRRGQARALREAARGDGRGRRGDRRGRASATTCSCSRRSRTAAIRRRQRLVELLRDGAIGEVRMIDAVFGYDAGPDAGELPARPRARRAAASSTSAATRPRWRTSSPPPAAGAASVEAVDVAAAGTIGPTGVDLSSAATLVVRGRRARAGGVLDPGEPRERRADRTDREGRIDGTVALAPGPDRRRRPQIVVRARGAPSRRSIDVPVEADVYTVEVDAVNGVRPSGRAVAGGDAVGGFAREHAHARSLARGDRASRYAGDDGRYGGRTSVATVADVAKSGRGVGLDGRARALRHGLRRPRRRAASCSRPRASSATCRTRSLGACGRGRRGWSGC